MLVASAAHDWNRVKADALVDESLSLESGYFYIARIQADNLLPKWYGKLGDTDSVYLIRCHQRQKLIGYAETVSRAPSSPRLLCSRRLSLANNMSGVSSK